MGNLIVYFNNNKAGSVQHPFKTPLKLFHFGNSSTSSGNLNQIINNSFGIWYPTIPIPGHWSLIIPLDMGSRS